MGIKILVLPLLSWERCCFQIRDLCWFSLNLRNKRQTEFIEWSGLFTFTLKAPILKMDSIKIIFRDNSCPWSFLIICLNTYIFTFSAWHRRLLGQFVVFTHVGLPGVWVHPTPPKWRAEWRSPGHTHCLLGLMFLFVKSSCSRWTNCPSSWKRPQGV